MLVYRASNETQTCASVHPEHAMGPVISGISHIRRLKSVILFPALVRGIYLAEFSL